MRVRDAARAVAAAIAVLTAACSGSRALAPPVTPPAATALSALTITLDIPIATPATQSVRRAAYISPNANSLRISLQTVNGSAPNPAVSDTVVNLTPLATSCPVSGSIRRCSVTTPAIVGVDVYKFTLYQSSDGSGSPLALVTQSITVTQGVAANPIVTFQGVDTTFSLSPAVRTIAVTGSFQTADLDITALDPSGATIVSPGAYATAFAVSISNDPNHALSAGLVGAPGTTGIALLPVTFNTLIPLTSGTVTVTLNGVAQSATIIPLDYTPQAGHFFAGSIQPLTITLTENTPAALAYVVSGPGTVTKSCVPSNCTPATPGASVQVKLTPSNAGQNTSVTIADGYSASVGIPIHVAGQPSAVASVSAVAPGIVLAYNDEIYFGENSQIGYVPAGCTSCTPSTTPSVAATGDLVVDGEDLFAAGSSTISELDIPACPICTATTLAQGLTIDHMALGADGELWVTDATDTMQRVALDGTITPFVFAGHAPYFIAKASNAYNWFTDANAPTITRFQPGTCNAMTGTCSGTQSFTATHGTLLNGIAYDPSGNVWVAEDDAPYIMRVSCSGACVANEFQLPSYVSGGALAIVDGYIYDNDYETGVSYIIDESTCSTTTGTCNVVYTGAAVGGGLPDTQPAVFNAVVAGINNDVYWVAQSGQLVHMFMP